MDNKSSKYIAKVPDADGLVHFNEEEAKVWQILSQRQLQIINNRACDEFQLGLKILNLPIEHVPCYQAVNKVLADKTQFSLEPVPALIPREQFFNLLANRHFPVALFIRRLADLDYIQEPDIFHELFGHCPLLTNQAYADFTAMYGRLALACNDTRRMYLERLYWFTIEFGLIATQAGTRIYGGGILSSIAETVYSLESPKAIRKPFNLIDVLRTPYRIDIMQPIYYVLPSFATLYDLLQSDLTQAMDQAQALGDFPPLYPEPANLTLKHNERHC
jgi:phenylalanine-4-hydroxylase